jgi:hypothetical protein
MCIYFIYIIFRLIIWDNLQEPKFILSKLIYSMRNFQTNLLFSITNYIHIYIII